MGGAAIHPSMNMQIANALGAVPEVESVYVTCAEAPEGVRVLTIVDQEDDRVYERIYEKEFELAQELPAVQFDFSIVARRGRPIEHIVGQNHPAWERSRPNGHPE